MSMKKLTKSEKVLPVSWEGAIAEANLLIIRACDPAQIRRLRLAVKWFQQMIKDSEPFPGHPVP